MTSRSASSRSSSSSSSSSSSLSTISNSLNIITNEINSLSLIATSLTQETTERTTTEKEAEVNTEAADEEYVEKHEESGKSKSKSTHTNRRVLRSLLKLIRRKSRKKLKSTASLNNLAINGKQRKSAARLQSKSIGNLVQPETSQRTKSNGKSNNSSRRRFRLIKHNSKKTASASASHCHSVSSYSSNNKSPLASSFIYSSTDLSDSVKQLDKNAYRRKEIVRRSRLSSSKELSWYQLEELDYYYKVLGNKNQIFILFKIF